MATPLMKQYAQMKAKHPDTVLLFRLGDFYETFEDDAKTAARVLGITLTKRGNGSSTETPLAGFPHHALEQYLPRLIRAGLKVAVCEQMEDPRFAKGLVKREITEVVTPGTAFSDAVLQGNRNNYLAAIALAPPLSTRNDAVGLAWADVTTGEFRVSEVPLGELGRHCSALVPAEILVQARDRETLLTLAAPGGTTVVSAMDDWIFTPDHCREQLLAHFGTATLKGFGLGEMTAGVVAAGALLHYLRENQKSNLPHMRTLSAVNLSGFLTLDPSTRRNLEIVTSSAGGGEGTLFSIIDRTSTPLGGRMLKRWINQPLRSLPPIVERLDAVSALTASARLLRDTVEILKRIGDLERVAARICTNRATPRETAALAGMLEAAGDLALLFPPGKSPGLLSCAQSVPDLGPVAEAVRRTLADDPPPSLASGGVVRTGVDQELDDLRAAAHGGKEWIANLQRTERERTGIPSLKVGFNNVFGYYLEITNAHREKVPEGYVRKQTLTGAERYITPELKEFEDKILNAEERILREETRIFNDLRASIAGRAGDIQRAAAAVATIDCLASFALVASSSNYVRPEVDEGTDIAIRAGRHPVIETLLPPGEAYTPNDTFLDAGEHQVRIITGPNMSGKSSFLRQTGLIVLLAQIGSFVPAASAKIGLVDAIFTRVGASDNIAAGESTFLVEMHEAAHIVNTATARSLILLDEVGRGTSTFDGISIAWALTEHLHDTIGAKTLFATHYHELNALADLFPRISNLKVDVREYGQKVVFLHTVTPGSADHSYGIQVARMAGLPEGVTARAAEILRNLESSELVLHGPVPAPPGAGKRGARAATTQQIPLFDDSGAKIREALAAVDPDATTPLEALRILSELKALS